jgi:hypothetical protein
MDLPEVFVHLDHLPLIDQYYIDQAHNAIYSFPTIDYVEEKKYFRHIVNKDKSITKKLESEKVFATPGAVQHGVPVDHPRHDGKSAIVWSPCDLTESNFGQDLQNALGEAKSAYLYNRPWSYYDWHRDLSRHECAINFVLTDVPESRTLFRHPTDCKINYVVQMLEYELYRPVLIKSITEHCVANLSDKHRYVATMLLYETTFEQAKEWLQNYKCNSYL